MARTLLIGQNAKKIFTIPDGEYPNSLMHYTFVWVKNDNDEIIGRIDVKLNFENKWKGRNVLVIVRNLAARIYLVLE